MNESLDHGFDSLIGFEAVADRLMRGIRADRVAHAQIFLGPRGSGKGSLTRIYARALLCMGKEGKPCGMCGPCRRMAHGNHPDCIEIRGEGKYIRVDDAKALQAQLVVRPYEGGRKVIVIHGAHTMTPEAQNKLLKALEEPPDYAVLLLLCETDASLLDTVRSRCQTVHMPRVERRAIAQLLSDRLGLDAARADTLSRLADGRVGRALELARSDDAIEARDEALALLITALDPAGAVSALDALGQNRSDLEGILSVWQTALRDALMTQCGGADIVYADRGREVAMIAERLTRDGILSRLGAVAAAERRLRGNGAFLSVCSSMLLTLGGHTPDDFGTWGSLQANR
jgi:DNA polymerase-3 subunit delta'